MFLETLKELGVVPLYFLIDSYTIWRSCFNYIGFIASKEVVRWSWIVCNDFWRRQPWPIL